MASTLWYRTELDLDAARVTLQQAMKSLGVTHFNAPDARFTGTDDPMQAHRRLPNFAAQANNVGGVIVSSYSVNHFRLYAEPRGTTVASGIGIIDASIFNMIFRPNKEEREEKQFHEKFSQAWREHDSSLTAIEHPGYLM